MGWGIWGWLNRDSVTSRKKAGLGICRMIDRPCVDVGDKKRRGPMGYDRIVKVGGSGSSGTGKQWEGEGGKDFW